METYLTLTVTAEDEEEAIEIVGNWGGDLQNSLIDDQLEELGFYWHENSHNWEVKEEEE